MHGPAHRHALAKPPLAPRRPHTTTWHGVELIDDYAWLRDENWQEVMRDPKRLAPEIRAYLEAENAYCDAQLSDTNLLQADLFTEMKGRLKENDSTVPAPDGPYAYYSSFVAGGQYPLLARRPRDGGAETVLLDGNAEAKGKRYWDLGISHHSPTIRYSPTRATTAAPSSTPSVSAICAPAATCPTRSPTRAAASSGPTTAARCFTFGSTSTTARCRSTATSWARR